MDTAIKEPLEVFALDRRRNRVTGSIPYLSLQWSRRYYECGQFVMEVPESVYSPDWAYIYTADRPETGIVQKVEKKDTQIGQEGIDTITLSGFFMECYLNRKTFLAEERQTKVIETYGYFDADPLDRKLDATEYVLYKDQYSYYSTYFVEAKAEDGKTVVKGEDYTNAYYDDDGELVQPTITLKEPSEVVWDGMDGAALLTFVRQQVGIGADSMSYEELFDAMRAKIDAGAVYTPRNQEWATESFSEALNDLEKLLRSGMMLRYHTYEKDGQILTDDLFFTFFKKFEHPVTYTYTTTKNVKVFDHYDESSGAPVYKKKTRYWTSDEVFRTDPEGPVYPKLKDGSPDLETFLIPEGVIPTEYRSGQGGDYFYGVKPVIDGYDEVTGVPRYHPYEDKYDFKTPYYGMYVALQSENIVEGYDEKNKPIYKKKIDHYDEQGNPVYKSWPKITGYEKVPVIDHYDDKGKPVYAKNEHNQTIYEMNEDGTYRYVPTYQKIPVVAWYRPDGTPEYAVDAEGNTIYETDENGNYIYVQEYDYEQKLTVEEEFVYETQTVTEQGTRNGEIWEHHLKKVDYSILTDAYYYYGDESVDKDLMVARLDLTTGEATRTRITDIIYVHDKKKAVFYWDGHSVVMAYGIVNSFSSTYAYKPDKQLESTEYVSIKGPWQLTEVGDVEMNMDILQHLMQWGRWMFSNAFIWEEPTFSVGSKVINPSFKNLGELMYSELQEKGASFRVHYDYESDKLAFRFWRGLDRTQEQSDNPWAVMSDTWGTLYDYDFTVDESNYRNKCYVLFDYEEPNAFDANGKPAVVEVYDFNDAGNPVVTGYRIPYHKNSGVMVARLEDGLPDAETYLDLRDQKPSCDGDWPRGDFQLKDWPDMPECQSVYQKFLDGIEPAGRKELTENYGIVVTMDTQTTSTSGYLTNFDLGDKIDLVVEKLDIRKEERIIGVDEVYEAGKMYARLIVGDEEMDVITRARLN